MCIKSYLDHKTTKLSVMSGGKLMKLRQRIILAASMLLLASSNCWGGEKAKLGPCVRQCVHAFNPSLADSGADEFMADDFRAKECVRLCKENLYSGECYSTADGCCHPDYLDTDPDCQGEPPPDPPDRPSAWRASSAASPTRSRERR